MTTSMKRATILGATLLILGCWFINPGYTSVTINQVDSPYNTIYSIDSFEYTGADMVGMLITFNWKDATNTISSQETTWGPGSGAHSGEARIDIPGIGFFSLSQQNDTFTNPWKVKSKATGLTLTGITIDGLAGNTVFDRSFGDTDPGSGPEDRSNSTEFFGSTGSFRGLDFKKTGGKDLDVFVTYRGKIQINGASAVGDIFRYLDIDFGNGLQKNEQYSFKADTDDNAVPLPGAVILLGAGLARLTAYSRRKRQA